MFQIVSLQGEKQLLEEALKQAEKETKDLAGLKSSLESQLEDMQVRRGVVWNIYVSDFLFVYPSHYCSLLS